MAQNIQISEFLVDKYKNLSYLKKRNFFFFFILWRYWNTWVSFKTLSFLKICLQLFQVFVVSKDRLTHHIDAWFAAAHSNVAVHFYHGVILHVFTNNKITDTGIFVDYFDLCRENFWKYLQEIYCIVIIQHTVLIWWSYLYPQRSPRLFVQRNYFFQILLAIFLKFS